MQVCVLIQIFLYRVSERSHLIFEQIIVLVMGIRMVQKLLKPM